eukprot:1159241-Pelagomonas_calceolata.AAC.8
MLISQCAGWCLCPSCASSLNVLAGACALHVLPLSMYWLLALVLLVRSLSQCDGWHLHYVEVLAENEDEAAKMIAKEAKAKEIEKSNIKAKSKMTKFSENVLPWFEAVQYCAQGNSIPEGMSASVPRENMQRHILPGRFILAMQAV